ncbi:ATP-dependent DNA helicase DDX11 [Ananas comosus]|uniref:ATP-dependent DNA helicase DDX11 n=1 Tax=Ananas comosus TaxID=4615 RepID=A0A6P5FUC5_ANACO|nr:ATP-dependent DNA helicase DDX11 [Ananas comosus]XP_020097114.1 ATP-dependent DNA helicase DDX11 [Ananas comosus]
MGEAKATKRRREFPAFPFDPYPIQSEFMAFLYDSLDNGGVAMLESPTGTGKTLSIICSAMQWVVDRRRKLDRVASPGGATKCKSGEDDEPDWMRDFTAPVAAKKDSGSRKLGFRSGDFQKKKASAVRPKIVGKRSEECVRDDDGDEEEFLVEDYESDERENERLKRKVKRNLGCGSSDEEEEVEEEEEEEEVTPKVYFTSRTHSQLSQFVKEFKRSAFASELNLVCLGSRKNLCINPEVLKLGSSNRINDRCLELQKNKKDAKVKVQSDNGKIHHRKTSSGCPMLRKKNLRKLFRDEVLTDGALDIEELSQLGSKIGTCPYYGVRDMVRAADLVVLPYQALLLKSARESLGLNLKNNIVIIDEAHNLADSLTNMYNSKISHSQLKRVLFHLEAYFDRFRNCLGAGNRRYIQTLIILTQSFLRLLQGCQNSGCITSSCQDNQESGGQKCSDKSMSINEFLFSLDIDNINFVKICQYVKESNIIHKVSGYGNKLLSLQSGPIHIDRQQLRGEESIVTDFQALVDILLSLINSNSEGRMIVSRQKCSGQSEEGYLKFVMLCGEKIFSEILVDAYAVILAGGTLQPIEETRLRLFPGVLTDQIQFFTCNHIVPPESILPIAVSRGPSGMVFDFSYNSRSSPSMIEELGRFICNIVAIIPEGIVIFFSSYDYEGQVYNAWNASGILSKIQKKKQVFREPRNGSEIDSVLKQYKEAINSTEILRDLGNNGAVLLAVVGGKISEGINFSDGMGRCVVMVGLPYPSPSDVELMERVKHIEKLGELTLNGSRKSSSSKVDDNCEVQSGFDILRQCTQRGREYYENLCMKAVNQSIGRAIRHMNDYAAMLLVDSRYACDPSKRSFSCPTEKLPQWIKDRLIRATGSYGEVHKLLHQFFRFNKQRRGK